MDKLKAIEKIKEGMDIYFTDLNENPFKAVAAARKINPAGKWMIDSGYLRNKVSRPRGVNSDNGLYSYSDNPMRYCKNTDYDHGVSERYLGIE